MSSSSPSMSTVVISPQFLPSSIPINKHSHLRLIFEGSGEPVEVIVPLHCPKCNNVQQQSQKRPFTFASTPFPFGVLVDCPTTKGEWTMLASDVYEWLKTTAKDRLTNEWRWAINYFWICYLASTPLFPVVTNPAIDWDPEFAPLYGEYLHNRTQLTILGKYVQSDTNAEVVARLVEWLKLRQAWILGGVDVKEFQRKVIVNEL